MIVVVVEFVLLAVVVLLVVEVLVVVAVFAVVVADSGQSRHTKGILSGVFGPQPPHHPPHLADAVWSVRI